MKSRVRMMIGLVLPSLFSYAQEADTVLKPLTRSIERAISRGHEHKEPRDFKPLVFSMLITFSTDAKVEDVIFSKSNHCSIKSKENISMLIRTNINGLGFSRQQFSNKFILAVVYTLPHERPQTGSNEIPENWESLFKGLDFKNLKGKSLVYVIPIGLYLLPRVEN